MRQFAFLALCLFALAALSACTARAYDDFVSPGKIYDPGTQ